MATDGTGPIARYLGRERADEQTWAQLIAAIPAAPPVFEGTAPDESPPIYNFCGHLKTNQWIGMCVGMGTRNTCHTMLRIPPDADSNSTPLPEIDLSALWCYWSARKQSRDLGVRLGREGAVVGHSLLALQARGIIPQIMWADSQQNQQAYNDQIKPPQADLDEGQKHLATGAQAARIQSAQQWYDFQGQGYPICFGISIGAGFMTTAEDGRINLGGRVVGGHCVSGVGYSKKQNKQWIQNSWYTWGEHRPGDAAWADCNYYTNIGYAPLDQFEAYYLKDGQFQSGETDAFVLTAAPAGFVTLIKPLSSEGIF